MNAGCRRTDSGLALVACMLLHQKHLTILQALDLTKRIIKKY